MNKDINGFHHLGLISRNMDLAIAQYERLGFLFTPLTIPRIPLHAGGAPEPIGAGNRGAIFKDKYLEVLAVVDSDRWASITREQRGPFDLDAPLSRYQGLHVLHLETRDLDHVRERLQEAGLSPSEIRAFQRMVDTAEGPRMMRALSVFSARQQPRGLTADRTARDAGTRTTAALHEASEWRSFDH